MKTAKKTTEHYLLPLNLCFLSFFGVFLVYELDKGLMSDSPISTTATTLGVAFIAVVFLTASLKFRSPIFQLFCTLFALAALAILF